MNPAKSIGIILVFCVLSYAATRAQSNLTHDAAIGAETVIGLSFSSNKIERLLPGLRDQLRKYEEIRKFPLSNSIPPAMTFNPIPVGMKVNPARSRFRMSSPGKVRLPSNADDLAF